MRTLIKYDCKTMFAPEKAKQLAEQLQADESDGWTYTVKHRPGDRFAQIEIKDADGEVVGYL